MDIQTSHFDTYQHQPIDQITLTNDHGISAAFLTLGATWQQFLVPTPTGSKNLLLSFPHSTDYLNNPFYVCMAIGRIGGRLKNGPIKQLKTAVNQVLRTLDLLRRESSLVSFPPLRTLDLLRFYFD